MKRLAAYVIVAFIVVTTLLSPILAQAAQH